MTTADAIDRVNAWLRTARPLDDTGLTASKAANEIAILGDRIADLERVMRMAGIEPSLEEVVLAIDPEYRRELRSSSGHVIREAWMRPGKLSAAWIAVVKEYRAKMINTVTVTE